MTKNEFLSKLSDELNKNKVADAADIVGEYEQHFAFKMADGFSEEEIAAKLGKPDALASQFETGGVLTRSGGGARKITTIIGLFFLDLFAGGFFALLGAWGIIMAGVSVACGAVAVCLFGGLSIYSLIPPMPYWCAVIFGLASAALAVLSAVGCFWFAAFVRQLGRSFGRFHRNAVSAANGTPSLPPLAISPQLHPKTNRRIRSAALISLALFTVCFVLGAIVSMFSAGALEFWHAWGWFGYTG